MVTDNMNDDVTDVLLHILETAFLFGTYFIKND